MTEKQLSDCQKLALYSNKIEDSATETSRLYRKMSPLNSSEVISEQNWILTQKDSKPKIKYPKDIFPIDVMRLINEFCQENLSYYFDSPYDLQNQIENQILNQSIKLKIAKVINDSYNLELEKNGGAEIEKYIKIKKNMFISLNCIMRYIVNVGSLNYGYADVLFEEQILYVELADSGDFIVRYRSIIHPSSEMKSTISHCYGGIGRGGRDHYKFDFNTKNWIESDDRFY